MFRKGYVSSAEVEADRGSVTNAANALKIAKGKLNVLNEFTYERQVAELTAKADDTARELERTKRSQTSTVAKAQSDFLGARDTAAIEKSYLEKLRQQLERCIVTAPQDGILVYDKSRPWDTSSRIQAGGVVTFQRPLFSIPDLKQMQVKVKIHESAVNKVRVGQQAELRVDAYTDNVLLVPIQAVAEKDKKHSSFVVTRQAVEPRLVSIGENNEKFVEIKHGLVEGERVTLDALDRLAAESGKNKADGPATKKVDASPATSANPGSLTASAP